MEVPERRPTPLLDAVTVALLGDVVPEVASGLWLRLTGTSRGEGQPCRQGQ